jgi:hypothetical protein
MSLVSEGVLKLSSQTNNTRTPIINQSDKSLKKKKKKSEKIYVLIKQEHEAHF